MKCLNMIKMDKMFAGRTFLRQHNVEAGLVFVIPQPFLLAWVLLLSQPK